MDACTVTAPDAITAFAVPNPNLVSQPQSDFSGPAVRRVAPPSGSLSLLWTGDRLFSPTLSTVDARNTNTEPIAVNAHYWCNKQRVSSGEYVSLSEISTVFCTLAPHFMGGRLCAGSGYT